MESSEQSSTNLGLNLNPIDELIQEIEKVIRGKRPQIELLLTALLAKGHILIEDNPGTGKTVLARALARAITGAGQQEVVFKRIQFTPDLLPMDLLGTHIFDQNDRDFIFKKGPLFASFLLADEINRASPKVQSALLESMAEGQITVGDQTHLLDEIFFVVATQNPVESEGTYPLPAAQLDRFFLKIHFGYVDQATELDIYKNYGRILQNLNQMQAVLSRSQLLQLQKEAEDVFIHEEIYLAVSNLVRGTREHSGIAIGASTRSGIAFLKCLRAHALIKGRNFVTEEDLALLAYPVLNHRLIYRNKEGRNQALQDLLAQELKRLSGLKLY